MDSNNELVQSDISKKEEICAKAKAIAASDDLKDGALKLSNLLNEWKEIRNHHTDKENELWNEFQEARAAYQKAREALREKNKALKEAIVEEAGKLLSCENFKEAGEKLNALMDKWKTIGTAGHENDESLWKAFNEKRSEFKKLRQEFFVRQDALRDENKLKKEELIKKAQEISDEEVTDWKNASDRMNALMGEWKAVGFAGKDVNDSLWDRFMEARKGFYDKRQEVFGERDSQRAQVAEVKESLIQEAQKISDTADYSAENAQAMKELDAKWKSAGSAGRDRENELWERFNKAKEAFWAGRHKIFEEKQQEWNLKKKEIVRNKKKQMQNLHDQVISLSQSIKNSTDWEKISRVRGWIEEKEQIIASLKKDIKDLES